MASAPPKRVLVAQLQRDREALMEIPNVGPATANDLLRLGIRGHEALAAADPDDLYERLCAMDGRRHDLCVRDVFEAAVVIARGGPVRPWWHYSRQRTEAADRE